MLVQKKLIRIISCAPFKAHTEPLMFARRIMSVTDINLYMSSIFMHQCFNCSIPKVFDDFFQRNNDVHGHNTQQMSKSCCAPQLRCQFRTCDTKIAPAKFRPQMRFQNAAAISKRICDFKTHLPRPLRRCDFHIAGAISKRRCSEVGVFGK